MNTELTQVQIAELKAYAKHHGRNWKSVLRGQWQQLRPVGGVVGGGGGGGVVGGVVGGVDC